MLKYRKNPLINYYISIYKIDIIDNVYLDYINFFQRLFGRLERIDMNLLIFYFIFIMNQSYEITFKTLKKNVKKRDERIELRMSSSLNVNVFGNKIGSSRNSFTPVSEANIRLEKILGSLYNLSICLIFIL